MLDGLNRIAVVASLSSAIMIAGCFKDKEAETANGAFVLPDNVLELEKRIEPETLDTNALKIVSMKDDDVIVCVNGYPLRKGPYEELMLIRHEGMAKDADAMSTLMLDKKMDKARMEYIDNFIGQRLLVDEAVKEGVVTIEEVRHHVEERISEVAAKEKRTTQSLFRSYGKKAKYLVYELGVSYAINKFIAQKIPPTVQVNDKLVKAVQEQVKEENERVKATNELMRARLSGWKAQLMEKELDFGKLSDLFSTKDDETMAVGEGGYWGEFEAGDMDSAEMEQAVFSLQEGEISDVLEDENGFHLVKVLKIIPEERNASGRIVSHEVRSLAHIYLAKELLFVIQTDDAMMADLQNQMQLNAINVYTTNLSTNGTSRVVFPHGRDLF